MPQRTHQPEPSLRHRFANRLESSLQNMHTPRSAPDPDPMLDITSASFDPSWAIFDQNSIQSMLQEWHPDPTHSIRQSNRMSGLEVFGFQGESQGQWSGNEDAWQSTLFRLFGSADLPLPENGLG